MEAFGIYSLKSGIVLTLFWGIYRLFLQKETFFRFNRFFLLTGLITALMLPLVIIHYTVEVSAPLYSAPPVGGSGALTSTIVVNERIIPQKLYLHLLSIVYLTVLAVLLIIRSFGLIRLYRSIRLSKSIRFDRYKLIESSEIDGAFSFFYFIFIPKGIVESEKRLILKHETVHIEQKHWLDLLFSNALSLAWWFNPMMRLYENVMRGNHEFLADREVLTACQPEEYRQTLLNHWFRTPIFTLANSFAYPNHLIRINMMKKNFSNPLKKLFALLAIPAVALFLLAFSEKEYVVNTPIKTQLSNEQILKVLQDSLQNSTGNPLILVDGKEFPHNISLLNPEEIASISVLKKDIPDAYATKGKNGVILITTKRAANFSKRQGPLYVVDGKEVPSIDDLKPGTIESITVKKDEAAISLYGEKAKNGVVFITTKEDSQSQDLPKEKDTSNTTTIRISGYPPSNFLIIVDGKEVSNINDLKPDNIESISLLKEERSIEIFGEKGKNGVLLISTKNKLSL